MTVSVSLNRPRCKIGRIGCAWDLRCTYIPAIMGLPGSDGRTQRPTETQMPRKIQGYTRPTSQICIVCGGSVPVAASGNIATGHPACMELRRVIARLATVADEAAEGRSTEELVALRKLIGSELGKVRTGWANKNANPGKRAK